MDKIDIKNLKSKEEQRRPHLDNGLVYIEEEDQDKKATLQAIKRIASVGGFTTVFEINQALALMSILMSTITFVVLLSWEKFLQADYKRHIVDPIYNIIGALGRLAADPRLAVKLAETGGNFESDENGSPTEIIMIGKAIAKFGHLLNIGFGEAGVDNFKKFATGQGEFHPVAKGKKSTQFSGFDIRNFTDLCEVLRRDHGFYK